MSDLLWQPTMERIRASNLHRFARKVQERYAIFGDDYAALHRWSVENRADFWSEIWRHGGVIGEMGEGPALVDDRMPGAKWFPAARLNFAQNLLRRRDDAPAIIFRREDGYRRVLSFRGLHESVASTARAMRAMGIEKGDRIAGYLPNMPETVIAMLACASIGAIWSSCSPDFGAQGVVDRFGQIQPRLLFAADGYLYAGKHHDCIERLGEIARALPGLERIVIIPFTRLAPALEKDLQRLPKAVLFETFLASAEDDQEAPAADPSDSISFEALPFDHPLYIMYSSGTTGAPKCIVHGAGGTLLQHIKEISLHSDLKAGQRMLYLTTCGWMMWNWLVSALACEATVVLYDGSPLHPSGNALFDIVDEEEIDIFGTSAKFIDAVRNQGIEPARSHALIRLKTILSTGSPLSPEGFDFVYRSIKGDICLSSISGGTDIMGCFALGNPTAPVRSGEIQCSGLGLDVHAFDDEGRSLVGEKGELVCTRAFPSMPLGFWNDPEGRRYHDAYFDRYEGVWCHGDYVEISESGGMIIHGRSDAVLNPGGVRIGTAEIYRQVEGLDEIVEALVVGQQWEGDVRIVLFVVPAPGVELNEALEDKIKSNIRANTTPRHVPARILRVSDIPRTRSGKITELAVRDIVHGRPVRNLEALANPEALDQFSDRPELRS
ncbi:acetoacetate--CoA ligase [Thioalkalivibrio sp. HK1]|uniref:acetoacetate--CoA ligase n=1 Tax=Thioalkalivibrio sp. HK1 TaxID=1469245 RepID=UPI0004714E5F|nr:acetoacetate--CoA ligase [Thioalkalivibrio sp. HK1]